MLYVTQITIVRLKYERRGEETGRGSRDVLEKKGLEIDGDNLG